MSGNLTSRKDVERTEKQTAALEGQLNALKASAESARLKNRSQETAELVTQTHQELQETRSLLKQLLAQYSSAENIFLKPGLLVTAKEFDRKVDQFKKLVTQAEIDDKRVCAFLKQLQNSSSIARSKKRTDVYMVNSINQAPKLNDLHTASTQIMSLVHRMREQTQRLLNHINSETTAENNLSSFHQHQQQINTQLNHLKQLLHNMIQHFNHFLSRVSPDKNARYKSVISKQQTTLHHFVTGGTATAHIPPIEITPDQKNIAPGWQALKGVSPARLILTDITNTELDHHEAPGPDTTTEEATSGNDSDSSKSSTTKKRAADTAVENMREKQSPNKRSRTQFFNNATGSPDSTALINSYKHPKLG